MPDKPDKPKEDYRGQFERMADEWRPRFAGPVAPQPITKAIYKEILRQRLAMIHPRTNLSLAVMTADAAIARAIDTGDIREIADRVDGKVPQQLEHTGADGGAIKTEDVTSARDLLAGRIAGIASRLAAPGTTSKPH